MKKQSDLLTIAVCTTALLATGAAQAQNILVSASSYPAQSNNSYIGVGLGQDTVKFTDGYGSYKSNGVDLRLGQDLSPNFAIEGRIGAGFSPKTKSAKTTIPGATAVAQISLKQYAGAYLVAKMPIGGNLPITPYVAVGAARTKSKIAAAVTSGATITPSSGTATDSGLSFGLGVDVDLDGNSSLGLEYMRKLHKSDTKIDAISLTAKYKF